MADADKLNYWERRAVWLEQQQHDKGDQHIETLIDAYLQAQKYLVDETKHMYTRYLNKSDLTDVEVARILNSQVTPDQLVILHQLAKTVEDKSIKKQIQAYLDGLAVKHRITELELLRAKSYVVAKQLADAQLKESKPYYIDVMQDAYNHATVEAIIGQTQKDFNVYQGEVVPEIKQAGKIDFINQSGKVTHSLNLKTDKPVTKFKEMSTDYVKQMLDEPWQGANYSKRIWNNTDELAKRLQSLFAAKQMSGMSERHMAQVIMKEFASSAYQARRLIRTEAAYMSNQARLKAWQAHRVEEYSLLAVLDFRTSNICRHMDGKVFKVKDARVAGKDGNYPPFHPHCRTVAVAHFTNSKHGGYRTARDPITNKSMKIPADATYRDWERLLLSKHGKQDVQLTQRMVANQTRDSEQFRRYQDTLGAKNMPKSFDDFQHMKYNDDSEYHDLVSTVREVNWERRALNNDYIKGAMHTLPFSHTANSVADRIIDDKLIERRYYGSTGRPRLDIDYTHHGNIKTHPTAPHAHSWTYKEREDGTLQVKRPSYRKLTLAERIVNVDDIR